MKVDIIPPETIVLAIDTDGKEDFALNFATVDNVYIDKVNNKVEVEYFLKLWGSAAKAENVFQLKDKDKALARLYKLSKETKYLKKVIKENNEL